MRAQDQEEAKWGVSYVTSFLEGNFLGLNQEMKLKGEDMFQRIILEGRVQAMTGENEPLVTHEPLRVGKITSCSSRLHEDYRSFQRELREYTSNLMKKRQQRPTCNQLDLETLGSWPSMTKIFSMWWVQGRVWLKGSYLPQIIASNWSLCSWTVDPHLKLHKVKFLAKVWHTWSLCSLFYLAYETFLLFFW